MTTSSILEVIQHYQRSIEKCQNDETRLLHCINKLYKLPVNVKHLQETGVGKTVNSLRKFNGEIGVAAKALVTKWKAMVAAEEEAPQSINDCQNNEITEDYESNHINGNAYGEEKILNNSEVEEKDRKKHKNDHEKLSKHNGSSHKVLELSEKHQSHERDGKERSSHKRKRNEEDHNAKEKSKEKKQYVDGNMHDEKPFKVIEDEKKKEHKGKHHKSHHSDKSDKHKEHRSSSKIQTDKATSGMIMLKEEKHSKENTTTPKDREKDHKHKNNSISTTSTSLHKSNTPVVATKSSDDRKRSHHSNESKVPKTVKPTEQHVEQPYHGIDSSMGANFEDVLGMLDIPTKKMKKSLNAVKTPSGSSTITQPNKPSTSKAINDNNQNNNSQIRPSTSNNVKSINLSEKPELLTSRAKLDPLDPGLVLDLPTISTNYKPMPLNQTVMDCVFNSNNSAASKNSMKMLNDAELLTHGISSKTIRTKIYSGIRTGQLHQVPSLFDLCIRLLQKNFDALYYTGGVPFDVLRPVLERATPEQLATFESYNDYLLEDSDVLWQIHVQRKYRTQKRLDDETWRDMYIRCLHDQERKLNILAENIKQSQKVIAAPVRKTQLAFVDSLVKPPRNVQRKQEQFGTKAKLIATPASRVAALSNVTPNAAKTGDLRLRVATTTRDYAQVSSSNAKPKKAPLMAKTLQFMRGRLKR